MYAFKQYNSMYAFKFLPTQSFSIGITLNQAWACWKIFIYLKTSKVNVLFMNWIEVLTVQSTPKQFHYFCLVQLVVSRQLLQCNSKILVLNRWKDIRELQNIDIHLFCKTFHITMLGLKREFSMQSNSLFLLPIPKID